MKEFPPSLISPSSSTQPKIPIILVDSREACLAEAGELIEAGIAPSSLVELGDVVDVAGEKVGDFDTFGLRREGRSLFKCVGIGGMDGEWFLPSAFPGPRELTDAFGWLQVAITKLVVELALTLGVGSVVPF